MKEIEKLKKIKNLSPEFLDIWGKTIDERQIYFKNNTLGKIFDDLKPLATGEGLKLVRNELNYLI